MKALTATLIFAALAASAGALYFHASASKTGDALGEAQSEVRQLQSELAAADIRGGSAKASQEGVPEAVLRSRIAELEGKLSEQEAKVAELNGQLAAAPEAATNVVEEVSQEERRARGREEWQQRRQEEMAKLRQEDPQEYARMQQERQDMQRRVVDHVGGQVAFFSELNTEGLSQELIDNHVALVAKLSEFQGRIDALNTDPAAGGDGRRELFGSMRELAPMLDMERQVLLNDFAMELGYKPDEADSFVEYVDYVNEMTSPRGIMRSMGGFGGRGGGGPGGR